MINVAGAGYMMGAVAPLMKEINRKESDLICPRHVFTRSRIRIGTTVVLPLHQGFESAKRLYV